VGWNAGNVATEIEMTPRAAYAFFVGLALIAAYAVRHAHRLRAGNFSVNQHRALAAAAIVGAMIGSRLGLVLYLEWNAFIATLVHGFTFDAGRTILGALAGGFVCVELMKKFLGIKEATGDAYAVSIPLGQSIGRVGCFFGGCCFGPTVSAHSFWATLEFTQVPTQLIESILCLGIAGLMLFVSSRFTLRPGVLFRLSLISYGIVRFSIDFIRADEKQIWGPFSLAQLFCVVCVGLLSLDALNKQRNPDGVQMA
jgi:phosphatidylglycerol---prolipoprotein diacylglyceryl transferase